MPEISACDLDKLRTEAEIARRVHLSEGHLPRPRPQALETRKQGCYVPPGKGKAKPKFPKPATVDEFVDKPTGRRPDSAKVLGDAPGAG